MRYIDADAFEIFGYTRPTGKYDFDDGVEFVLNKIDETPTADVRENVRGEWVVTDDEMFVYCSNCEDSLYPRPIDPTWNFCPNCGARMDERKGK